MQLLPLGVQTLFNANEREEAWFMGVVNKLKQVVKTFPQKIFFGPQRI